MSTIVRSWIKALCGECGDRQIFELQPGWVLICSCCGHEKRLEENGLLAVA